MSDFLSNVTARALGTAQVVQPRIPSLFEPYRVNEGPFVTRTTPSFADAGDVAESSSDTGEVPQSRSAARIAMPQTPDAEPFQTQAPTPPQARQRVQFDPKDGAAVQHLAQAPSQPPSHTPAVQERQPSAAPLGVAPPQTNSIRMEAEPREAPQSPASAQGVRSPGVPRGEVLSTTHGRDSSVQNAQSVPGPAPHPVAMPAVRPPLAHAIESSARSPVPLLHRAAADANSGLPVPHLPTVEPAPAVLAPLARASEPRANPLLHPPAARSDSAAGPDFLDRRLLSVPTQISTQELLRPSGTPVQPAQSSPEISPRAAVFAAPAARGAEAARAAAAFAGSSPAEPAIEVTIGTVEVRAIFPEKPAPRAPSRRPKPGISLDEYLKRPSRGSR